MTITVGAYLQGSGDFLIDDLRLEIVGSEIPLTGGPGGTADSAGVAMEYLRAPTQPVNLDFELGSAATAGVR